MSSNNLKPWQKGSTGQAKFFPHLLGEQHPRAKLTDKAVLHILSPDGYIKRKKGHTIKDLARKYNVSPSAIEKILWSGAKTKKKNWSHLTQ